MFSFFFKSSSSQSQVEKLKLEYLALLARQKTDIDNILLAMYAQHDDLTRGCRQLQQLNKSVVMIHSSNEPSKSNINSQDHFHELGKMLAEYPSTLAEKYTSNDIKREMTERDAHHAKVMELAACFLHVEHDDIRSMDASIQKNVLI